MRIILVSLGVLVCAGGGSCRPAAPRPAPKPPSGAILDSPAQSEVPPADETELTLSATPTTKVWYCTTTFPPEDTQGTGLAVGSCAYGQGRSSVCWAHSEGGECRGCVENTYLSAGCTCNSTCSGGGCSQGCSRDPGFGTEPKPLLYKSSRDSSGVKGISERTCVSGAVSYKVGTDELGKRALTERIATSGGRLWHIRNQNTNCHVADAAFVPVVQSPTTLPGDPKLCLGRRAPTAAEQQQLQNMLQYAHSALTNAECLLNRPGKLSRDQLMTVLDYFPVRAALPVNAPGSLRPQLINNLRAIRGTLDGFHLNPMKLVVCNSSQVQSARHGAVNAAAFYSPTANGGTVGFVADQLAANRWDTLVHEVAHYKKTLIPPGIGAEDIEYCRQNFGASPGCFGYYGEDYLNNADSYSKLVEALSASKFKCK